MNKHLQFAFRAIAASAASFLFAALASATTLTSNLNVDNGFMIFVSTTDADVGTYFGGGNNWGWTSTSQTTLDAGSDYFVHIYAWDEGGIAGILGQLSLDGDKHQFANGQTTLLTGTSFWNGNNTWFGEANTTLVDLGQNGVGPWGYQDAIAQDAHWMWAGDANNNDVALFSAQVSAVPEPASLGLLGLGLLGVAVSRRKAAKRAQA